MRITKLLLLVSLVVNLGLIGTVYKFAQDMGGPAHFWFRLTHNGASGIEEGRNHHFQELSQARGGIVMLGDSLTHNGEWHELLNRTDVYNRGTIGQWSGWLAEKMDFVGPMKPETVFLMMGVNDIMATTAEQAASSVTQIVKNIKNDSPATQVFLQSVLPVNNLQRNTGRKNEDVVALNGLLVDYCANNDHCEYIDLHKHFVDDNGRLNEELATDGVHLNGTGYRLWANLIEPYATRQAKAEPTSF